MGWIIGIRKRDVKMPLKGVYLLVTRLIKLILLEKEKLLIEKKKKQMVETSAFLLPAPQFGCGAHAPCQHLRIL